MEMNVIGRLNESQLIKATNDTIRDIVKEETNKLGNEADLNHIDVSEVTSMSTTFLLNRDFDGDISHWNTENVKNMSYMFQNCKFDGDISNWNIESVKNMYSMFWGSNFRGDLNNWKPFSLIGYDYAFKRSPLESIEPIWGLCLKWGLFKTGEDYCDSLKYGWLRDRTIFIGRLKTAVELFDGDLSNIDRIMDPRRFTFKI